MANRESHASPHLSLVHSADWESDSTAPEAGSVDALFFSLVGAIQNPVFVKDERLRFVYVNTAFRALMARPRAKRISPRDFEVRLCDQAHGLRRINLAVIADGLPRETAEAITDASGNEFTIVTSKSRFEVPGRGRYLLGVITDTTLRTQNESALVSAKIAAEAANLAKSCFLANMSHELRTPLNAIIAFSEIIKDGVFGVDHARYQGYADDIFRSGGHLLKLINDILDLSKIDAGKYQLNEEACDLSEAVTAALLFVRDAAQSGAVTLHHLVPPELPPLWADLRAVTQIVTNLVANAVKFTEPGGRIEITATLAGDGLSISIADTGIGMKPTDIPRVLIPFQQLEGAWERKYEGTGLGLPLTKALLTLHGGSLQIDSELGLGTTVTARFPVERTIQRPAARAAGRPHLNG